MQIGEFSELSGVSIKTLRYYEEVGLLPAPNRTKSGYRDYSNQLLGRLQFIKNAKAVGFSLREIREILFYRERGEIPCSHVNSLLQKHFEACQRKIRELEEAKDTILVLIKRAKRLKPQDCNADSICHLV